MTRVVFSKGKQQAFLELVKRKTELNWEGLGEKVGVCARTVRDWRREKYFASYEALLKLGRFSGVELPRIQEIRKEHWSVHKAAIKKNKIYGVPWDLKSRRGGGVISQKRRREKLKFYRRLGCLFRNKFDKPQFSDKLAELVGIILGDGSITKNQVTITLNKKNDQEYARFTAGLFKELFSYQPSVGEYPKDNTLYVRLSGINLIEYLEKIGLKKGDKIRNQVDFPDWVKDKLEFRQACVRGLFDTDGGLYFHRHWSKGIRYRNLGFCFTSYSKPLVMSFFMALKESGFNCKLKEGVKGGRVFIYELKEIKRYFLEIGSNNPKNAFRFKQHLAN